MTKKQLVEQLAEQSAQIAAQELDIVTLVRERDAAKRELQTLLDFKTRILHEYYVIARAYFEAKHSELRVYKRLCFDVDMRVAPDGAVEEAQKNG